jgi:GT2 family glycosyltransferase
MDNEALIGVVTVSFNSASVIRGFMDSLLQQKHAAFILYVIDNASSDETLQRLAEYTDPRVVKIRNSTNVGVAEGNNIGIRAALKDNCAYVLLVNNDTVFDDNLLSQLKTGLQTYACDMIVPKIVYFDVPDKIWCAGGYFRRLDGTSRHFGYGKKDDGRFDQSRSVPYSPTCCMLIKAAVFERIGLMDANYFVYFDDADFCHRAQRQAFRLYYLSSARVRHKVSSLTGGAESDFTVRYCTRNQVYYVLKNLPRWQLLYYLPLFQIRIFAKYFLLSRRLTALWMAEKAFFAGVSLFNSRSVMHQPSTSGQD